MKILLCGAVMRLFVGVQDPQSVDSFAGSALQFDMPVDDISKAKDFPAFFTPDLLEIIACD
ncbi:hypothetical protein [uncultured Desulfovibrio sp.]|uniref:hypothetical protein n=1 Tax=uncultured Desulfovibrio sp. TaxID=167968 RepID=UPI0026704127|nr:hypothetical protein [uncultured Desulfovibrio sp.]